MPEPSALHPDVSMKAQLKELPQKSAAESMQREQRSSDLATQRHTLQQLHQDSERQRQTLLDLEADLEQEMARKHNLVVELKKVRRAD